MSKSPEEYFQEQAFAPAPASEGTSFTEAELAFMRKYMGLDATETLRNIGIETVPAPAPEPVLAADAVSFPEPPPAPEPELQEELPAPEPAEESAPEIFEVAPEIAPEVEAEVELAAPPVVEEPPVEEYAPTAADSPAPVHPDVLAGSGLSEAAHALAEAASALTEAATALSGAVPSLGLSAVAQKLSETGESIAQAVLSADAAEDLPAGLPGAEEAAAVEDLALPEEPALVEDIALASEPEAVMEEESASEPEIEAAAEAAPLVPEAPAEAVEAPAGVAPAAVEVPDAALPTADPSDLATYSETVNQQLVSIKAALAGLQADGEDKALADALYRSLVTIKNSSNYMGLDDIKVYAERTSGIVDQGRNTAMDFSILVSLLEQECGIIEDMIRAAIERLSGTGAGQADAGEDSAPAMVVPADPEPVVQAVFDAPAPAPEPAVEVTAPKPVAEVAPEPEPVAQATPEPEPVAPAAPPAPTPLSAPPAAAPAVQEAPQIRPVAKADPDIHAEMSAADNLDAIMREEPELQMVGFYLGTQEFTVPTIAVQEVIRYQTAAKLPAAPEHVAGVINLRGKMTPLVYLRDMLEVNQERKTEDRFIIVCRRKGLQFGLIIERVHTMYRVPQADIDWGIESHLGVNVDLISGLLKLNDNLVAIVSVDRIVDYVLEL